MCLRKPSLQYSLSKTKSSPLTPTRTMYILRYLLLWALLGTIVAPSHAQSLVDRYREARFRVQVSEYLEQFGEQVPSGNVRHIPTRADTLQHWLNQLANSARIAEWNRREKNFEVEGWRLVRKLERPWFSKKFENTLWAFLGTESLLPVDTTYTRDLRAKLEAYYGPPTQTISELLNSNETERRRDRYMQFEYWFVVNDSIPVVLMDVNGPLERGLIVSSDERYRDILLQVRESLLREFLQSQKRAPYVDYYYDAIARTWYYAGFDGREYFYQPISSRPNLALGRPWLDIINRLD